MKNQKKEISTVVKVLYVLVCVSVVLFNLDQDPRKKENESKVEGVSVLCVFV